MKLQTWVLAVVATAVLSLSAVPVSAEEEENVPPSPIKPPPNAYRQKAPPQKQGSFYGSSAEAPKESTKKKPSVESGERSPKKAGVTAAIQKSKTADEEGSPGMAIPAAPVSDAGEQKLMPELTMKALLSASDVNRFVCSTDIKDVTWSKEKGVIVKYSGRNAFVKFNVLKSGEKIEYPTKPVEFFISCGNNIYNVIGVPKRIVSQTIRLTSGSEENIRKNASLHAGQSFEKKLLSLIRAAYTDEIPESYTVEQKGDEVKAFRDLAVVLRRTISVEGEGLVVREFYVSPRGKVEKVGFTERDFLDTKFAVNPVAISADKLALAKGEVARVFIVDAKEATNVERP